MEVYYSFYAGSFSNDQAKILAINIHLKDKAAKWLQLYVADYLGLGSNLRMYTIDTQQILGLWDQFKTSITSVFGEVDKEQAAVRALKRLE
jgi:hypothetical protein